MLPSLSRWVRVSLKCVFSFVADYNYDYYNGYDYGYEYGEPGKEEYNGGADYDKERVAGRPDPYATEPPPTHPTEPPYDPYAPEPPYDPYAPQPPYDPYTTQPPQPEVHDPYVTDPYPYVTEPTYDYSPYEDYDSTDERRYSTEPPREPYVPYTQTTPPTTTPTTTTPTTTTPTTTTTTSTTTTTTTTPPPYYPGVSHEDRPTRYPDRRPSWSRETGAASRRREGMVVMEHFVKEEVITSF